MDITNTDNKLIQITEIILTATAVNGNPSLDINDIPVPMRKMFSPDDTGIISRPITIKDEILKIYYPDLNATDLVKDSSYITKNDMGQFSITTFGPALTWYLKQVGSDKIMENPALTLSLETSGVTGVSYTKSRAQIPLFEDTSVALSGKIDALINKSEKYREAIDLVVTYAPDQIEFSLDDLVCTQDQLDIVNKIHTSLKNREFLRNHRIYEIGRILLVGPPGTGKTSFALAISRSVHMPVLEVRLSMLTSQYLGETSKNIDRIFDLAKQIAPCILFIDEFDYIAKTRVSDDNGTMKRAVNTLLKSIDHINLIKDRVLLIGATNYASMLDEAAWRRFDEVISFTLPDVQMREKILQHIASGIPCTMNFKTLAEKTEGFSGADLRMMLTESIVSALLSNRKEINESDISSGIDLVNHRNSIRHSYT